MNKMRRLSFLRLDTDAWMREMRGVDACTLAAYMRLMCCSRNNERAHGELVTNLQTAALMAELSPEETWRALCRMTMFMGPDGLSLTQVLTKVMDRSNDACEQARWEPVDPRSAGELAKKTPDLFTCVTVRFAFVKSEEDAIEEDRKNEQERKERWRKEHGKTGTEWDGHGKTGKDGEERGKTGKKRKSRVEQSRVEQSRVEQSRVDIYTPLPPEGGSGEQTSETSADPEKKGKPGTPVFDAWFEQFWSEYPRKVKKDDAKKAARAAWRTSDAEKIGAALRRAEECDHRFREREFTPYPGTWLRERPWEGEGETGDGRRGTGDGRRGTGNGGQWQPAVGGGQGMENKNPGVKADANRLEEMI